MTDEALVIGVAEIRVAVTRLLDAATERFGPLIDLDADYYWTIPSEDAFEMSHNPEVVVGQLSDDVSEVRQFIERNENGVFLWHDLQHVIGILGRIASLGH